MAQTIRNKYLNYWWDLSSLMTVLEPYSQLWSSEELFFFFFLIIFKKLTSYLVGLMNLKPLNRVSFGQSVTNILQRI